MSDPFVGLHVHSEHSFLDGQQSVAGLVNRAVSLEQGAATITDHQEVSAHVQLFRECQKAGIKPIYGMEGYFHADAHRAKELKLKQQEFSHITVLAKNREGLRNLWAWSSEAYTRNFYRRALVDWDDMKKFSPGLYASDGCGLAHMAKAIIADDEDGIHQLMGRYLDTFGDNFYMELHTFQFLDLPSRDEGEHIHKYNEEDDPFARERQLNADLTKMNQRKVELASQYGVPLVVVNDAHYGPPEDWKKHNLVWAMSTANEADKTGAGQTAAWMMGSEEIVKYMALHGISEKVCREAIANTAMIADSIEHIELSPELKMPKVNDSEADDIRQFLRGLEDGIKRKVIDKGLDEAIYRARLETEIPVITDNHFAGYFNVMTDLVRTAKDDMGMFVGPGRGSAGGALASYLLGITELDPIKYDLLFERFLADGRKGLPDIDVDFQQSRLGEIKEYTAQRYGHSHVCGIGTVSRNSPKAMLNDICRSLGVSIPDSTAISKTVGKLPVNPTHTPKRRWDDMIDLKGKELLPWIRKYPDVFKHASQMIGMARQSGVHASGWIISPEPLLGNLPLRAKEGKVVSQFEQGEIEWLGYVKFDLLGIRHLDTIKWTLDAIKERHGVDIDLYDFGDAEYADPAIWEQVGRGDTLGLFQLEADLMADTSKRHKPQSEREVAELLAINRPGVIDAGLLTPYIERKHGREEVSYDHPMLRDLVGETYGILIYQEQIMKMSRKVAGFTAVEADWLRSVVGKKKVNELPTLKEKFVAGCRANQEFKDTCYGGVEATITKLWTSIEASGEYLFNKSHSMAYALIGSWEAWLRHYYYPEFIWACMKSDPEKVPRYVRHAHRNNVPVLPPDINQSGKGFVLTDDGVRYGLTSVKDVGENTYAEVLRTRPYESLADMIDKVERAKCNKRHMLNLIHIGAFDSLNPDRTEVEEDFYKLRKVPPRDRKEPPDYTDLLHMYRLEKELVGSHILYDPLAEYHDMIGDLCLKSPDDLSDLETGSVCKIGGLVTKVKPHKTKKGKGDWMGFLTITYDSQDFELLVFPEAWASSKTLLELDRPVIVRAIKLKDEAAHVSQVQRLDYLTSGRN